MAKSNFEPKKIVRYAESSIPKNGISSRPTPRIQRSTSATGTGLGSGTGASDTPPPPPPPPVGVPETRSFLFDGATELTGSALNLLDKNGRTVKMTVRPAWESGITGSWALLTLGTPNSDAYREEYKIENNITYGPSFNTTLTYATSSSLTTADSASVNNDIGVDAADYTEVEFNWVSTLNETALHLFKIQNGETPWEDITIPAYTRKDSNRLIFVVKTTTLAGIERFKHRVRVTYYQKTKSQFTQEIISGNNLHRSTKPLADGTVGSGDVLYLEFKRNNRTIEHLMLNGEKVSSGGWSVQNSYPTVRNIDANDSIAIGGLMSGSEGYFSGSIDQVAIFSDDVAVSNKSYALDFSNESNLQIYYQFEGTTAASVGNDLQVVGVETYISSSL